MMKKALIIFISFLFSLQVNAQLSFSAPASFFVGGSPRGITTADFNLDGKADVAVAHDVPGNNVRLLLGNGTGGFAAPINTSIGYSSSAILSADFNIDGKPDLITLGGDSGSASIALGNGNGTFSSFLSFRVNGGLDAAISADFNLDGKPDLATADYSNGTIALLLGDGLGGLGLPIYFLSGSGAAGIISNDFNGDNKPDIAVIYDGVSQVVILLGNGQGGFSSTASYTVAWYPLSIVSADFNEDGETDIATANYYGDNVSVLLNNGNGTFAPSKNFSALISSTNIVSADYNVDNHMDLAVTKNDNADSLAILLGIGNGYFCKPVKYALGSFSQSLAQADFNNDGKMDLVTDIWINNTLALIKNNSIKIGPTNIIGDSLICKGKSTTLSVNNSSNIYYWTGPAPDTNRISSGPSAVINQPGIYTLHDIASCLDIANFTIKIDSITAAFTANPVVGNAPTSITFTSNSQSTYSSIKNYIWSFGNGSAYSTTLQEISNTYNSHGVYPVALIVTNNNGCSDSITHYISIIEIPNIFTPNGDNINDIFFIKSPGIISIDCTIYDRWGLQMYQWTDANGGWDGKNKNGVTCNEDTYFYLLKYIDLTGKTEAKNGFVQLQR